MGANMVSLGRKFKGIIIVCSVFYAFPLYFSPVRQTHGCFFNFSACCLKAPYAEELLFDPPDTHEVS